MLFVDRVALLHRRPQPLVAHDDRVDRSVGIESKLILAQDSQLPRTHDSAFLRIQFTAEQLHERGFARAIGPGQAIPLPRRKRRGDFIKQNFGAVAHRHITD